MNRRTFLEIASQFSCAGASLLLADNLLADLRCSPFNAVGVQQCEAGIDSSILEVVARDVQHASEWCWAASIAMIFAYYGHHVSQEQIVAETWGNVVNMPGQPYQILSDLNRNWTDADGTRFRASGETFDANPITASQDLGRNMPLVIGTLGHAMVLTSLVYLRDALGRGNVTQAIVRDPWPGRGRRVLSPQEWYSANFLARIRVHAIDSRPRPEQDDGQAQSSQSSGDFCETAKQLIDASRTGFRSIKGRPDPTGGGETWVSTLTLPGSEECTVWIFRDRSLGSMCSCRMMRSGDLNMVVDRYQDAVRNLKTCLPSWSFKESTTQKGRTVRRFTAQEETSGPSVGAEIQTLRTLYILFIEFNSPSVD